MRTRHDESDVGGAARPANWAFGLERTVDCKRPAYYSNRCADELASLAERYVTVEQTQAFPISAGRHVSTVSTFEGSLGRPERSFGVHSFATYPMTEHMGHG